VEAVMDDKGPNRDVMLVDSLRAMGSDALGLWKYFEDRADYLADRLWTTGTWLTAILAAVLAVAFSSKTVEVVSEGLPLKVSSPLPLTLIAAFGVAFSIYALAVVIDIKKHIESNWRRAKYIRTNEWDETVGFRKSGWRVLSVIIILELIACVGLLIIALAAWFAPCSQT
jgi:hypothetical protein